ncbi:MAG: imidazole glycerol phosphate synthase cyclase subunit [Gammaproteobacteria bacterium]|jgi:cyclase
MLRHRVIPVVLINGYSVLKTIRFSERRNLGNPITVARTYNTRNVDELILLDIDASTQKRSIDMFTVREIASECFMPLTVGGGLRSIEDIQKLLKAGADKVSLNYGALVDPEFVRNAVRVFGAQCIVVSIDIRRRDGVNRVWSRVDPALDLDPLEWIARAQALGAGELLINFVDRDGTMEGCDQESIGGYAQAADVPLIACGGISGPDDCVAAIRAGASAVAAASIFHFTNVTPNDCKRRMAEQGIPVRLLTP